MQISTVTFSLLVELIILLLLVLGIWSFISFQRRRKDRAAATKLVEQIRHQSELRLKETGSFLEDKYKFEGNELEKAIKTIDQAEKKFMQRVINMYLTREPHDLEVMDASLAELIEAYKALTPAQKDNEITDSAAVEETEAENLAAEVESLRETNAKLTEELAITKKTMGNMIAEFGNMFGGGQDNELAPKEVLEKVNVVPEGGSDELIIAEPGEEEVSASDTGEEVSVDADEVPAEDSETAPDDAEDKTSDNDAAAPSQEEKKKSQLQDSLLDFDEGIDELMDGIDLSDDV